MYHMERCWRLPAPLRRGHGHIFQLPLLSCIASCYCSCWVFLVGLSSVLNFTIQKCYLAQALKKSFFTPQTGNWSWWRRAVLPQLAKFKPKQNSDREEPKQNKLILVIHFSQSLILILTWILLAVRNCSEIFYTWEDTDHSTLRQQVWNMVICFYYCFYISKL